MLQWCFHKLASCTREIWFTTEIPFSRPERNEFRRQRKQLWQSVRTRISNLFLFIYFAMQSTVENIAIVSLMLGCVIYRQPTYAEILRASRNSSRGFLTIGIFYCAVKALLLSQPHVRLRDFHSFISIACWNNVTLHEASPTITFSIVQWVIREK